MYFVHAENVYTHLEQACSLTYEKVFGLFLSPFEK